MPAVRATAYGKQFIIHYPQGPGMVDHLRAIFEGEYWIPWFLREEPGSVVDVGAGVGETALLFRAAFTAAGVVYAIEPSPITYEYLVGNTSEVGGVKLFEVALSDKGGEADLYRGAYTVLTDSLRRGCENLKESVRVKVRRASEFFSAEVEGPVVYLKVDTEGSELPILQDLAGSGELGRVQCVAVETHSDEDRRLVDGLLSPEYLLVGGGVLCAHRYVFTYLRRSVASARTGWDNYRIGRQVGAG